MTTATETKKTITLTALEARALSAAITWAQMAEQRGTLELYDYQKEAFEALYNPLLDIAVGGGQ